MSGERNMRLKIEEEYGNIYLIEKKLDNTAAELKDTFPDRKICVCDFYVAGSESGKMAKNGSISFDDLVIIDHHLAIPEMRKHISSTTLANKYVTERGPLNDSYAVIINHTDTDSMLSSLIMSGKLKPHDEFDMAAVAADHTGAENIISDLLQALEDDRCLDKSVDALQKIVKKRLSIRQKLRMLVDNGEFKMDGSIAYILLDRKIDAGLLPFFFPAADAVIVAWPMPKGSKGKWGIKTRLVTANNDIVLNKMDLPDTGGRWNAVSTTRHGGTDIDLEEYVKIVKRNIERIKKRNNSSKNINC
jgi:hypothetical protein